MSLALPALGVGWIGDDYFHLAVLHQIGPLATLEPITDLFSFMKTPEQNRRAMDAGLMTWWADPTIRTAFLRPVTALTHLTDKALWPATPALQHAHSLGWYGLAVAVVAGIYRRVHRGSALPVAGLAALLWAVEDAHAMPVAWLANRNALLAVVFGGLGFLSHMAWRDGGRPGWLLAALGSLALGLFAGEATIGAIAYIAAYQLALDEGGLGRRLSALIPYVLLVIAWRGLYHHLGYGAAGSGLYLDPGREPLVFGLALVERWPILLAGQWLQVPVDVWLLLPPGPRLGFVGLCGAGALGVMWWLAGLVRQRAEARFWALGMGLSLVPLCAAFPMDRLLIFAGIGAFGLLAMMAQRVGILGGESEAVSPVSRRLVWGMLALHGPVAAMLLTARVALVPMFGFVFSQGAQEAPQDDSLRDQTLVFVTGNLFATAYTGLIRAVEADAPVPRRVAQLGSMFARHTVTREDADTLVLTAPEGFLVHDLDLLFRSLDNRFTPGQAVHLPDLTAEVRSVTDAGVPTVVAFHFNEALEHPSYRWMVMEGAPGAWPRFVPFTPPQVGAAVELSPP